MKNIASGISFQNKILTHENQTLHIQNILAHEKNHFSSIEYEELLHKSKQENEELRAIQRDMERRIRLMEEERYLTKIKMDHLMEQNDIWIKQNGDVQRILIRTDKPHSNKFSKQENQFSKNLSRDTTLDRKVSKNISRSSSSLSITKDSYKIPDFNREEEQNENDYSRDTSNVLRSLSSNYSSSYQTNPNTNSTNTTNLSNVPSKLSQNHYATSGKNHESIDISQAYNQSKQSSYHQESNQNSNFDALQASIENRKRLEEENKMLHKQIQVLQDKILLRDQEIMNLTNQYVAPNPQQLKESEKQMEQQRAIGQLVEHIRYLQDELERTKIALANYERENIYCTCRYEHSYQ